VTSAPAIWVVLTLVFVLAGAVVQGVLGWGFAFLALPVVAQLDANAIPYVVLLLSLPLVFGIAHRDRGSADLRVVAVLSAGRLVGSAAGVWLLVVMSQRALEAVLGIGLLLAVAGILVRAQPRHVRGGTLAAGTVSGVFATATGIGGAPVSLALTDRSGAELRSTLSLTFMIGSLISTTALLASGHLEWWHVELAAQLLPAMLIGLWISGKVADRVDGERLRYAVLAFASIVGVATLAHAALG
jgi:uncharacterized protein